MRAQGVVFLRPREAALELFNLGTLARLQGDRLAARASFGRGLAQFRELGARGGAALLLDELGRLELDEGNETQASTLCQESLALYRELGDRRRSASLQEIVTALGSRPEPARTPRSGGQRRRSAGAK